MTVTTLLNGERIRTRRITLGLTVAALATRLGVGADLIRALEGGATSRVAALPLEVVLRLAGILHLAPAELFAVAEPDPASATADDRAVEAALLAHGDTITTDDLAAALGWPLGRLERALGALRRRLRSTGARLCRTGWHRYRIQPDHRALPKSAWRHVDGAHREHRGLTLGTATPLCLLARGIALTPTAWEGDDGLRELHRQQLIDGDPPPFRLSADVRYSLLLDDE